MKPKIKIVLNLVYWLVVIVLVSFGAITALSVFAGPGNYRFFVVGSGSMSPALKLESVVLMKPKSRVGKVISPITTSPLSIFSNGDIITYFSGKNPVTHRVIKVEESGGQFVYQTKGDANRTADSGNVSEKDVLGRVIISIPYLGYAISFAKTQMGYIFLIVIPTTIIVYSEILNINSEVRRIITSRRGRQAVV